MQLVVSLCYWAFLAVSAPVLFLGAALVWLIALPIDRDRRLLHGYTCWWSLLYLRCLPGCRISVEGREKIRPRTAYILAANHQNATDIMALSALGVFFKWVSKREAFRIPFTGWNMYLNGYVKVDRGNIRTLHGTMKACRDWLDRGVPLLIFPEGSRSKTGELKDFHRGAFKLAADTACAVVPIVVDGTFGLYRGVCVRVPVGPIRIRVLDPIRLEEAGGKISELQDLVHGKMKNALAEMRGTVLSPDSKDPLTCTQRT